MCEEAAVIAVGSSDCRLSVWRFHKSAAVAEENVEREILSHHPEHVLRGHKSEIVLVKVCV